MNSTKQVEIRMGGTGGQGLITIAIILAEAAVNAGKNVVQTQSYGPEARGGSSKAEIIISDEDIAFPKVRLADILLVMSQEAAKKYGNQVSSGALVISDSDLVHDVAFAKALHYPIPITMMAKENLGNEIVANIIALGIVSGLSGVLQRDNALEAIAKRLPPAFIDLNKQAFEMGWKVAEDIMESSKKEQLATG